MYFRNYQSRQELRTLVFYLAISDFILGSSIFISQLWLFIDKNTYTYSVCVVLRSSLQFGCISSFLWTSLIAFFLWRSLKNEYALFYHDRPYLKKYFWISIHLIAWGLPAIMIVFIVSFGMFAKDGSGWCALNTHNWEWWFFWFIPLSLSLCWNVVMYFFIMKRIKFFPAALKNFVKKKVLMYIVVFFVTNLPIFVDHLMLQASNGKCSPYFIWIIQDLLFPLGGFLNFLVYTMTRKGSPLKPRELLDRSSQEY
eukprot:TRINITY_DN10860_c0_g1_i1.p1 TRINITY_DN10860_c0_g1~~TRINITY_DN10860_c0_g1_i1.p1  ORF type:complete len:254 (+),score=8.69 TRINITY_DN10860_c0_g1_i1:181-942(+)